MIDTMYYVTCDGPDPEDPGEPCPAEFEHCVFMRAGDIGGFRRQLNRRGWVRSGPKTFCPLHKELVES